MANDNFYKNNDIKSKYFDITVEYFDNVNNFYITPELLKAVLSGLSEFYAFILHDHDIDLVGVLERPHYHVYVKANNNQRRLTFLNKLVRNLNCNANAIGIANTREEVLRIQYMVHKNDPDKYQYSPDNIVTNNPEYVIELLASGVKPILTANMLIEICIDCNLNRISILKEIGLGNYTRYHNVIANICAQISEDGLINYKNVLSNQRAQESNE